MIRLTKSQILSLHESLVRRFGGEPGVRDENLLELSLYSPYQTFDGTDLYKGDIRKAVHLGFSLIRNHPFIDGNKRIGIHAMLVLLELNGYIPEYSQEELISITMNIASSKISEENFLTWVKEHIL